MNTLSGTALADYGHPVFQRDGDVCVYCGFNGRAFNHWRQLSVDHIRPKSAGGSDSAENLVTACNFCNSATSRLKFKAEDSEDYILKMKKEYVRSRLKQFHGFWSDKVDNRDEAPPPEQGGPYFPVPFVLKLGKLELTDELEASIKKIQIKIDDAIQTFAHCCEKLSKGRHKAAGKLSKAICRALRELGMPDAQFDVQLNRRPDPEGLIECDGQRFEAGPRGIERGEFFISPQVVTKCASGATPCGPPINGTRGPVMVMSSR